ncbi:MAG TPA: DUF4190 domain-containing protein [Dongiaceae bacterium]|nr:DUF4190 domain-containing protein [Dongiaceae bacterium]
MKQCPNCRGTLADFVAICPYCGAAAPVVVAPQDPQAWDAPQTSSNKALASLICGILFLFWPAAIAAIILGHLALVEIKRGAGRIKGQGLAFAGLAMGYVGLAIGIFFVVAVILMVRANMGGDIARNETSASLTLAQYKTALEQYKQACPQEGYPDDIRRLGPGFGGRCQHANLLPQNLATKQAIHKGYVFVYTAGTEPGKPNASFVLLARPLVAGRTGRRLFYMNQDGIVPDAPPPAGGARVSGGPKIEGDDDDDEEPPADAATVKQNEAAALVAMNQYNLAMKRYHQKCPQFGYPDRLERLGPGAGDCQHAKLLDAALTAENPSQHGYTFEYHTGTQPGEKTLAFVLLASPTRPGATNPRYFYLDEQGVVRESNSRNIGPGSRAVDMPKSELKPNPGGKAR